MKKLIVLVLSFSLSILAKAQFSNVQPISTSTDSIGIYFADPGKPLQRISPIKFYKMKTNTLGMALSGGLASANIKAIYSGSTSANKMTANAHIIFYFADVPADLATYYMFSRTYSVRNFMLCKLKTVGNKRELSTGKIGITGNNMGATESEDLKFNVKNTTPGVYEITFNGPQHPGEYCFVFNDGNTGAYNSVFDFTVYDSNSKTSTTSATKEFFR